MEIHVNDKLQEMPTGISLLGLLTERKLDPNAVAVEYNEKIVPREEWKLIELQQGDHVQIVRFVGGG